VSYSNDVASVVVVVHLQGTFRNCEGYFNEIWYEDTFGQYAQSFFDFRDLTYFVAGLQAAILKIRLLPFKS
jgi:hypothetical protein